MFFKSPQTFIFTVALTVLIGYSVSPATGKVSIPLGGNAYITKRDPKTRETIGPSGLVRWSSKTAIISIYFKTSQAEMFTLSLKLANPKGTSKVRVSIGMMSRMAGISSSTREVSVGKFSARARTYVRVNLKGVSRSSGSFADVTDLQLDGIKGQLTYVKEQANFYYGRRGPSANVAYLVPYDDVEFFYNEVTIPKGNDPISCYFMTIGTSEGYSGIQRNSQTERRIIFSVFSKYPTDDPTKVPPEARVKLLRKGPGVVTQDFGNEGSGGQSRLVYPWKTGLVYGFLLQTKPTGKNSTIITCWVNLPGANNKLRLIASFEQPATSVYSKGLYSFSENFAPDQGYIPRMGMFGRSFYYRKSTKKWEEVTEATFGVDETGSAGRRKDYSGGATGSKFYLRNIGFINRVTEAGTQLKRQPSGKKPTFDLNHLP